MYLRIIVTLAVLGTAVLLAAVVRLRSAVRSASPNAELRLPGETDARLDAHIAKVRIDATFAEAIEQLKSASGANMYVRWAELPPDAGGRAVRVMRDDQRVGDVIEELIRQLRAAEPDGAADHVDFSSDANVIVIGRQGRLPALVRYYNVRDLVIGHWPPLDSYPEPKPVGLFSGGGSSGYYPEFGPTAEEILDELRMLIQETIDPEHWRDNGGSLGAIGETGGVFTIRTSWPNHRRIEHLLMTLRAAMADKPVMPATGPAPREGRLVDVETSREGERIEVRLHDIRGLPLVELPIHPDADADAAPMERLFTIIQEGVDTDSWRDHGGTVGAMWELNDVLVIRQSPENHPKIADLLAALRRKADWAQPPATSPAAPPSLPPAAGSARP